MSDPSYPDPRWPPLVKAAWARASAAAKEDPEIRLSSCPQSCPIDVPSLQAERDRLARRVDSLWRQRQNLCILLAAIRRNGGCSQDHWNKIDAVIQAAGLVDPQADSRPDRVTVGP